MKNSPGNKFDEEEINAIYELGDANGDDVLGIYNRRFPISDHIKWYIKVEVFLLLRWFKTYKILLPTIPIYKKEYFLIISIIIQHQHI